MVFTRTVTKWTVIWPDTSLNIDKADVSNRMEVIKEVKKKKTSKIFGVSGRIVVSLRRGILQTKD